ncbi:MAG: outer membrane protein, partial [Xanthobacteraceae bacterium]
QSGHFVLGVEGDWQWSGQKASACVFVCDDESTVNFQQRLNSIGTLRGRFGIANDGMLFYGTVGAATASVDTDAGLIRSMQGRSNSASFHHTMQGWVAGGGIEAALDGNWTAKIEYLYTDLGSTSDSFNSPNPPSGPITTQVTSDVREHIFRAGINYRFAGTGRGDVDARGTLPLTSVYDWTGFYVGGNAGYGAGRNASSIGRTVPPFPVTTPELFAFAPSGWLGGVQAGYNWQVARNWVFGVEADYQFASQTDAACLMSCELTFGDGATAQQTLSWFSTVRGRVGYANGPALLYLTGGLAMAGLRTDVQSTSSGLTTAASFNHTRTGWAAGGGIETALGDNWSGRVEYLHMDFRGVSDSFLSPSPFTPSLTTTVSSALQSDMIRVGLNYRLAGPRGR